MTDWMTIRILLEGRAGERLAQPPGRVMLAHADHTFAELAEAVDGAFARWDLSRLHAFEVEGRRLVYGGDPDDVEAEDSEEVALGEVGLRLGSRFTYVFDLGDRWTHDCTVEGVELDPIELAGEEPGSPVPVFGWGTIPDQYGRVREDDEPVREADWPEAEETSWEVVAAALADVERRRDDAALQAAATRLRAARDDDPGRHALLWAAAGLDDGDAPADDERLWLELAAGVVAPCEDLPIDPDLEAAWAALEPADWAGAVIELVRAGEGQPADPDSVLALIARCPEVDSDELTAEDEDVLLTGLGTVVQLWRALGIVDADDRLTALGRWGLPEALRLAWTELL